MPLTVFLSFAQYFFVVAYTPGPANLFAMNVSMRYGFKKFLKVYIGLYTAFSLILLAAGTLTTWFAKVLPQVTNVLTVIGAVYILWLAYHIAVSKPLAESKEDNSEQMKSCFWSGFLLNMSNVKVMFFCISLFQLYLSKYLESPMEYFLWGLPISVLASGSTFLWALLGQSMTKYYNRHYRAFNMAMALMLVACVVSLFL